MKFKIVFENSGDTILFSTDVPDLLNFYVDFLNENKANSFKVNSSVFDELNTTIKNLFDTLIDYNNSICSDFTGKIFCPDNPEYLIDQDMLNRTHSEWVHSNHIKYYTFDTIKEMNTTGIYDDLLDTLPDDDHKIPASEILYKYNAKDLHNNINILAHDIECVFNSIKFQSDIDMDYNWIEIKNPFTKKYTSNSLSNLSISFNHYGRTLYNKFKYKGPDINFYDDENSFNQLLGFVTLSLLPPESIPYSKEYVEWCNKINREPAGDFLNLGNIENLAENSTKYRQIIHRNILHNNKFSIEI